MPNWIASIAAAVAVVDADLFVNEVWAQAPYDRILQGLALTGSAVVGDTKVELYIDTVYVGVFFNNKLAFPNNDDLLPLDDLEVPATARLRAVVRDAAATNPINAMVAVENAG